MARSTLCSICNLRPVGGGKGSDPQHAKSMGYCASCLEEAEWENTHSDHNHELTSFHKMTEEEKADRKAEIAACWICKPELNEAQKEYKPRNGTTREGMVMHVTLRASGPQKAAEVIEQFKALPTAEQWDAKISKPTKRNGGITTLRITSAQESYTLRWDARGRFETGTVTEDGKTRKIRNAAEALRLAR